MNKSNEYLRKWLSELEYNGTVVDSPRTKWSDGEPAYYTSVKQKVAEYDIIQDEFPINTLRPTALRGCFEEISWIYQAQSSYLNILHPDIRSWWSDFVVNKQDPVENWHIGQRYGHTVARYNLMDKLLSGLLHNPFGRRHQIDLWQEQEFVDDPNSLPPCVFLSMWSVSQYEDDFYDDAETIPNRYLDLTIIQRSMDALMTHSINPTEYTMLGMMVVSHLNFHQKEAHYKLANIVHIINDYHVYDRHQVYIGELLSRDRELDLIQPTIKLKESKDFYDIKWEDFEIEGSIPFILWIGFV